jgi:hypothetical protein
MFRVTSRDNINEYADSVTGLIKKCIDDVLPIMSFKRYPNKKMWIDGSLVAKLERESDHKHGKVNMDSSMVKQHKYNPHRSIMMAKHRGAIQWVNTRRMWQGLLTIMDYGKKDSHVAETNAALPEELNTFFSHFKHNDYSELPRRIPEDNEDHVLAVSTKDVCKSFKWANPHRAAGPDSIPSLALRACADQLAVVF